MTIIQKLSDMIEEEIGDAGKYARCAMDNKETDPALADTFFRLANEEVGHVNLLHAQVTRIIEEYRKANGDPPEAMLVLYDNVHKKHIENLAVVKGMLSLYK